MKLIMNLMKKDSGEINIFGMDNGEHELTIKQKIGFVYDENYFYEELTIEEMKNMIRPFYKNWREDLFQKYVKKFHLLLKKQMKHLSKGMKMKFSIRKNIVVLSKYISIFVFSLYAILFNIVLYFVLSMVNTPLEGLIFTMENIYVAILVVMLYSSISFPFSFKLGYHQAKMANFILFFALIFGGTYIVNEFIMNQSNIYQQMIPFFNNRSNLEIMAITFLPFLFIYILSYFLSVHFYKNREY